jgi:hypothetical protein
MDADDLNHDVFLNVSVMIEAIRIQSRIWVPRRSWSPICLTAATRTFYLPTRESFKGQLMATPKHESRDKLNCARWLSLGLAICAAGVLAGCATSDPPVQLAKPGYSCVDDSIECINRRQALLRQLTADTSHAWMKEQPTPEAYASGVRLFAMKTKKKDLSCAELAQGRQEADRGPQALRGPGATKLTPAQVSRGVMFAGEVSRELGNEIGRRCKRA